MRVLFLFGVLSAAMTPTRLTAQEDTKETPLGDVARNLRKKASARPVIDEDNFDEAMQQAQNRRGFGSSMRLLMSGEDSNVRLSAPDVTCSLSFSSNLKSLLSRQYSEMALPTGDLGRLEGHASIDGNALTVSIHNGTDWHVSEIAVAFTTVNSGIGGSGTSSSEGSSSADVRAERKPDATSIFRMRAVGVPWSVATFRARLENEFNTGSEWHWAIVEAKGYPPESYRRSVSPETSAESDQVSPVDSVQNQNLPASITGEITPVSNAAQDKPRLIPSANPQQ